MPFGVVKSASCEQAISAIPLLELPSSLSVHTLALSETDTTKPTNLSPTQSSRTVRHLFIQVLSLGICSFKFCFSLFYFYYYLLWH